MTRIVNKCLTKIYLAGSKSIPVTEPVKNTYCEPCDVYINENGWDLHVEGKKHHSNENVFKKNKLTVVFPGKFELDDKKSMYIH